MDINSENLATMKHFNNSAATPRMSGEDRREMIETAAVGLFSKHGYRGTTTREIAHLAGVSEASIFQYFNSKAELYAAVLKDKVRNLANDWLDEISECAADNDDDKFFQTIAAKIADQFERNAEFLRLLLYSALEGDAQAKLFYQHRLNALADLLSRYIERRQQEKAFQPCDADAAAKGFIGAQIHYAITEMLTGEAEAGNPDRKSAVNFARLTLDGLRNGMVHRTAHHRIF